MFIGPRHAGGLPGQCIPARYSNKIKFLKGRANNVQISTPALCTGWGCSVSVALDSSSAPFSFRAGQRVVEYRAHDTIIVSQRVTRSAV